MRNILIICLLGAVLSGCSVYRIDIQQGNVLEDETIARLKPGMTRQQVKFLMGTPLIQDPFHPERWDYVHTFQPGSGKMTRQHLTLFFEADRLARIDKSGL